MVDWMENFSSVSLLLLLLWPKNSSFLEAVEITEFPSIVNPRELNLVHVNLRNVVMIQLIELLRDSMGLLNLKDMIMGSHALTMMMKRHSESTRKKITRKEKKSTDNSTKENTKPNTHPTTLKSTTTNSTSKDTTTNPSASITEMMIL